MADMNTVTIPLEEYIELRRRADESVFIVTKLGALEDKLWHFEDRLNRVETKMEV